MLHLRKALEKTARDILNWRRCVGKLGEIRFELQELLLPHIVVAVAYRRLVKVVIVMVGLLYEGPKFLDPRLCVCLVHVFMRCELPARAILVMRFDLLILYQIQRPFRHTTRPTYAGKKTYNGNYLGRVR